MSEPGVLCRLLTALDPDMDMPPDSVLLERFVANRDAGAFELLVWRHAAMVLRACRAILRDSHAAEDAAQATFLALARQASSVGRTGSVAGWLFRVARRVAIRSVQLERKTALATGMNLDGIPTPEPLPAFDSEHDRILHEELAKLPEKYRAPILLCYFNGLTQAETARRLGWPVGTVAGRLARARDLLAARLKRRGVTLAVLIAASAVAIPPAFAGALASAASAFVAKGQTELPEHVLELANREVRAMIATRAIWRVGALAACAVLALGVTWAADQSATPQSPPTAPPGTPAPRAGTPEVPKAVVGKRFAAAPVTTDLQRKLMPGNEQKWAAVVFVDGAGMFSKPNVLDAEALNLNGIRDALKKYGPDKDRAVYFLSNYRQGDSKHADGTELLRLGLDGLGRQAGFGGVTSFDQHGFDKWDDWIAPLKNEAGASAEEKAVGDERVRAFPVKTPLSRVLTGSKGKSPDAVIYLRITLDPQKDDWVPAEVEKSMHAAIAALKLPKGKALAFGIPYVYREKANQQASLNRMHDLCRRWAEENKLTYFSLSYAPQMESKLKSD